MGSNAVLRVFLLPGNLVCDALGAREEDDRAMIRSLINMLVWNLVQRFHEADPFRRADQRSVIRRIFAAAPWRMELRLCTQHPPPMESFYGNAALVIVLVVVLW